jgi:peroxiredoxin
MRGILRTVYILVLIVVFAWTAASAGAQDTAMRVKIGEKAPNFRMKDVMTGKTVTLSEFTGKKVVMLEFWATWCDICKREMPNLIKLYNRWKGRGFELLSIVLPSGNIEDIRKIVREYKVNYGVLLDSDLSVATKSYGLAGPIPLKVVIDSKGVVRYTHVGDYPPGEDELPFVIEDLLKEMEKGK